MLYLLNLEWKKNYKNLIFRILIISYAVLLPSGLLIGKKLKEVPPPLDSNQVFFMFPTVWNYLGYVGNWLSFFFLGFFAVLMVSSEYGSRTLRQNIITGLHRWQFLLAKLYFALAICIAATLYYTLCALVIGYFHTDYVAWSKVFQNGDLIPRYLLMCFSYMAFGIFLGVLIKRTGIALFVYFAYIMFVELILRWGVHLYFFKHKSMHFYPANAIEDLVPTPFAPQAEQFLRQFKFNIFLSPLEATITSLVYLTIFLLIIFRYIRRADL